MFKDLVSLRFNILVPGYLKVNMIGMLYKKVVEEGEEEAGEILNYSNP